MKKNTKQGIEVVEHPSHYRPDGDSMKTIIDRINKKGFIEAIDIIDAWNLNFDLGSAVKYILRCGKKDDEITELEKTVWYLNHEIENRKSK